MRNRMVGVLLLATLPLAAGCAGSRAVEIKTSEYPLSARWTADVATPPELSGVVQIHGSAWMAPVPEQQQTRVTINLANATPGGVHPWGVYYGRCGSAGGVVGDSTAYQPLEVSGSGKVSETAMLSRDIPSAGAFVVRVLASKDNRGTVIACGNLAPPTGA